MSKSFVTLVFELIRQYLQGTIFSGVMTSVSKAPGSPLSLSLSRSVFFDQINADVLLRRVNYLPSNYHVSYDVIILCFNMNGSEWGLKMQREIYSIHMVKF